VGCADGRCQVTADYLRRCSNIAGNSARAAPPTAVVATASCLGRQGSRVFVDKTQCHGALLESNATLGVVLALDLPQADQQTSMLPQCRCCSWSFSQVQADPLLCHLSTCKTQKGNFRSCRVRLEGAKYQLKCSLRTRQDLLSVRFLGSTESFQKNRQKWYDALIPRQCEWTVTDPCIGT